MTSIPKLAVLACILSFAATSARAQEVGAEPTSEVEVEAKPIAPMAAPQKLKLSKQATGTVPPKERMFNGRTISEIRQARAIYRADQRILRIEHNRWAGHSPLRPNISGNPDLFNGINTRRTIYVPVFVR